MKQKKLMLLGGLRFLIPIIEEAHNLGCYVITVDYLPDNIAHNYSDEYHNVSITNKEAVLALAKKLQIDGIMSFAVDPGVVTAAYVAEKMNLPKPASLQSVEVLQNKDLFRKFLFNNGFNTPQSVSCKTIEEANLGIDKFTFPLIVKPTDAAGSKGVKRIDSKEELPVAFQYAKENSISQRVIIEEFIEKVGETTGSDSFVTNGKLTFFSVDDQIFDINAPNPYTPIAHKWSSSMPVEHQEILRKEVQRLIDLLEIDTSILNIEARVGKNNQVYIMEVSPRGGGNRLAEILEMATGAKLIANSVKFAIGMKVDEFISTNIKGVWHSDVLFSNKEGIFEKVEVGSLASKYIADMCIYALKGDKVYVCTAANQTIGNIVYHFNSENEYKELYDKVKRDIFIKVK